MQGTGENRGRGLRLGLSVMPTKNEWMTQCLYPPPLADLDFFRCHPPLLMFTHELEASAITA